MKKLVVILFLVLIGIGLFLISGQHSPRNTQALVPPATTSTDSKTQQPTFSTPSLLQIRRLGVDATVEHVGMDAKGNMDVPKDEDNVAWYTLGHKVGAQGSAVIAGHFDKRDGSPAVFYRLASLTPGDEITVIDDKENELTFEVIRHARYPFDDFPLEEVFNTTDRPRLNLITCEGDWNKNAGTYSDRLVVYTQLKQ